MVMRNSSILISKKQIKKQWEDLQKWIKVKQLRVVVLVEGDDQNTAKRWIKKIQEWSIYDQMVTCVTLDDVINPQNKTSYFQPLISKLPFKEQITFFNNCWYGKSIEKSNLGKWGLDLWTEFDEKEVILRQAGFIVIKYALHDPTQPEASNATINGVLKRTESETHPFFHFNSEQNKKELYQLTQHLIQQISLLDASNSALNN